MRQKVREQGMTPRLSDELNHLLPFKTLMMQITINAQATSDIKNRSRKEAWYSLTHIPLLGTQVRITLLFSFRKAQVVAARTS